MKEKLKESREIGEEGVVSTGDFGEALQSLLGAECPGLSASAITNLKKVWEEEYRQCILVLMGAAFLSLRWV